MVKICGVIVFHSCEEISGNKAMTCHQKVLNWTSVSTGLFSLEILSLEKKTK